MIAFYGDKKFADLYNMNRLQIQNDIVLHIEDIRQENLKNIINNLIQAKNKNLKCNTVQKIWFDYIVFYQYFYLQNFAFLETF